MSNQNPPPTLTDVLDARIQRALAAINCHAIATVQAFDSANQTATVSINYKRIQKDAIQKPDGTTTDRVTSYPLLVQCPVLILKGGTATLTMPIVKGDLCLLLFNDREIDTWFTSGNTDKPPASSRMHDLTDAVVWVGLGSLANPIASFNTLIASLTDLHGERLAQTGDIKDSIRTTDHDGWVMMKGDTVGKATGTYQGEKYRALFDFLKAVSPNAGTENFDAGGTVVIPDVRGRGRVCADNMGGSQKGVLTSANTANRNVLGGAIGEETHLLTGQESGIQQHHHTYNNIGMGGSPWAGSSDGQFAPWNTGDTGHTNAINVHNNVPPGSIFNTFIKI